MTKVTNKEFRDRVASVLEARGIPLKYVVDGFSVSSPGPDWGNPTLEARLFVRLDPEEMAVIFG